MIRTLRDIRPARHRDERGFSLIELMVSLALMTIIFGITAPGMSRYLKTNRLLSSANDISAAMRYCRQRAVSEENNVVFSWSLSDNKYRWLDDDDNDGTADTGEFQSAWKTLPSGIDLQNGSTAFVGSSVTFHSDGSASQGGQLKVVNSASLERTIQLVSASGLVKVLG